MHWLAAGNAMGSAATGAMIRVATEQPSRRVRYGIPILLITAAVGGALLIMPAVASRGLFQLLLLPVLLTALGLGLGTAMVTLAVGALVATLALTPTGLPWVSDPFYLAAVGLYAAEGLTMAFIGAVVRAAIGTALAGSSGAQADADVLAERPRVGPVLIEQLTERETEVLRAAASGRSVEDLAAELYVSPNTVKTHLAHCYDKLGAHSRTEAIALAIHAGCLEAEDLDRAGTASAAATA
jgi:DNA-binding CsgD family transcriptional regulator